MIVSFKDSETEDIFEGEPSAKARRRLPVGLHQLAQEKLDILNAAETLDDAKRPPGNRLEALRGARAGQHSIRINRQYRICFTWTARGPDEVEITDYH